MAKLTLISATQRVERLLHFSESEADQLCIIGVYLKNDTLAVLPMILAALYVQECP